MFYLSTQRGCTGQGSNSRPSGPKSEALTTEPPRHFPDAIINFVSKNEQPVCGSGYLLFTTILNLNKVDFLRPHLENFSSLPSFIPVQLFPSPVYPWVQWQECDPYVFVQTAFLWHLCLFSLHSSKSDSIKLIRAK